MRMLLPLALVAAGAAAQPPAADPAARRAAIAVLAPFEGRWRGPATVSMPGAPPRTLIQTERVGRALGGDVAMIEGHAYNPDGSEGGFNALAIVSVDAGGAYEFRSYAQGHAGTFPMTVAPGRFAWAVPAGPDAAIRYTATVEGGTWREEGWYERGGKRLAKVFEMSLSRIGDSDWPAAGAVPPR